jgi:acyl carrier protein
MNKKEFIFTLIKCLNIKKKKNLENLEWDSLGHLTILIELEKKFPNRVTSIKNISEATNQKKLFKLLKSKKLILDV